MTGSNTNTHGDAGEQYVAPKLSTVYSPSIPIWVGMDPRALNLLCKYNDGICASAADEFHNLRRKHGGFPDLMPASGWEPGQYEGLMQKTIQMRACFTVGVYLMKGTDGYGAILYKIGHSHNVDSRAEELNRTTSFSGRSIQSYAGMVWKVLCVVYGDNFENRATREAAERSAHQYFAGRKIRGRSEQELFKDVSKEKFMEWAFRHYPDAVVPSLVADHEGASDDKLVQALRIRIDYVESEIKHEEQKSFFQKVFRASAKSGNYPHISNPVVVRLFELIENNLEIATLELREPSIKNGILDYAPLSEQKPFFEKVFANHLASWDYIDEFVWGAECKNLPDTDRLLVEAENLERSILPA